MLSLGNRPDVNEVKPTKAIVLHPKEFPTLSGLDIVGSLLLMKNNRFLIIMLYMLIEAGGLAQLWMILTVECCSIINTDPQFYKLPQELIPDFYGLALILTKELDSLKN